MWVDPDSIAYFQQQVDQHGAIVLEGVPALAERFITLSGAPRTNIAVVRASEQGYAVLVTDDLTPRVLELTPYFAQQPVQPGWRVLHLPAALSVEEALAYAGHVLGLEPTPAAPAPASPAPMVSAPPASEAVGPGAAQDESAESVGWQPDVPRPETTGGMIRVPSAQGNGDRENAAALPFTTNLTEAAARGEFQAMYGRQREIDQIVTVLLQKEKNCPLLVGEPGTGKTAIVEKLACMAAGRQLPPLLDAVQILSLDVPQLLAQSSHKGDVEKHVTRLLEGLVRRPAAVLFVDEIHNLTDARGDLSVMEMLKSRLARGLRMIGATTHAEFKQKIQGDGALVRRFSMVTVNEPDVEETEAMVLARMPALEAHHGIRVAPAMVLEVVRLADEYFPDRYRPDKAFTLLDRAMAAEALKVARSEMA